MRNNLVTGLLGAIVFAGTAFAGPEHDHGKGSMEHKPLPNCPIMGEPINLAVSTATDEGPAFFCCEGCVKKYKADPAKYASAMADQRKALAGRAKVQTACPVSGNPVDKKVSIDDKGTKVYFCCQGCVSKYQKEPGKYATALANSYTYQTTCVVMGNPIDPTSFTELADGRKIYYCCNGCEGRLFGSPAKYAKKFEAQGYQYNWAKIKKAGEKKGEAHGNHGGHDHSGHNH